MKIPTKHCQLNESISPTNTLSESDKKLLNYLSIRLSPCLGVTLPSENLENFCRVIENLCITTCVFNSHDIECSLSDLLTLKEKLTRIISYNSQQGYFRAKLKFCSLRFNLKINRLDEGLGSKSEIAEMFLNENLNLNTSMNTDYIKKLETKVEELEFLLELEKIGDYVKYYPKYLKNDDVLGYETKKSVIFKFDNQEFFNLKKFAAMQCKIINEKEFDAFDAKILKAKYAKKLKKLGLKKNRLNETETLLRKKNLEIEKEKNFIENGFESLDLQKSKFNSQVQQKLSALNSFLTEISYINLTTSQDETSFPSIVLENTNIDSELIDLSQELKNLEFQYKSRKSLNRNTIESQIEKVKNRVSALKSLKAIQNISKPSISTSPSSFYEKNLSPRQFKPRIEEGKNRVECNETELRRQLRIKELRMKEKEEEILEHEERNLKYWKDNIKPNEVLNSALVALNHFKEYRDKYERRVEFVEKKRLELQETLNEIAKREAMLEELGKSIEFEQGELDLKRNELGNKVKVLIQVLEKN